jgi:drug/metabolite transporter (DMT)-like permease
MVQALGAKELSWERPLWRFLRQASLRSNRRHAGWFRSKEAFGRRLPLGYFLVLWSLFSYGILGICHKLAERKECRPQPLAAVLMLGGFLGMNVFVLLGTGYSIPHRALYTALICGTIALCALWAFQEGIKHGKIATSWLIINLSSAIPTVASIVIYQEAVSLKKLGILGLIVIAIVLVWLDRREDLRQVDNRRPTMAKVPVGSRDEKGEA